MEWVTGKKIETAGTARHEYTSGDYRVTPTRGARYYAYFKDEKIKHDHGTSLAAAKAACEHHNRAVTTEIFVGNVPPTDGRHDPVPGMNPTVYVPPPENQFGVSASPLTERLSDDDAAVAATTFPDRNKEVAQDAQSTMHR